jgi:hypothetical protein
MLMLPALCADREANLPEQSYQPEAETGVETRVLKATLLFLELAYLIPTSPNDWINGWSEWPTKGDLQRRSMGTNWDEVRPESCDTKAWLSWTSFDSTGLRLLEAFGGVRRRSGVALV